MKNQHPLLRPRAHVTVISSVWALLVTVEWILVAPTTVVDYAYYGLAAIAFLPFALLLTNFLYHFVYAGEALPRVSRNEETPRVAVLYTTYNDIVPYCVAQTANAVEYPVDFWMLSDSDVPEAIATELSFDDWRHFTR